MKRIYYQFVALELTGTVLSIVIAIGATHAFGLAFWCSPIISFILSFRWSQICLQWHRRALGELIRRAREELMRMSRPS